MVHNRYLEISWALKWFPCEQNPNSIGAGYVFETEHQQMRFIVNAYFYISVYPAKKGNNKLRNENIMGVY